METSEQPKLRSAQWPDGMPIVFETSDRFAMINLVTPQLADEIRQLDPDFLLKPEDKLKKAVNPSVMINRLRFRFWDEYHLAQKSGRKMRLASVFNGVCSEGHFYHVVVKDKKDLSWIVTPPADYMIGMEVALNDAMEQIAEVVHKAKLVDKNGKIDAAALGPFIKTLEFLHNVVKGPIVQKTMNLNMNANAPSAPNEKPKTPEERARRVEELKKLLEDNKVIDVNSK